MNWQMKWTVKDDGSLPNLFQNYFAGLDANAQSLNPLMKSLARWQLEWMGLMSRRGQAYLEIPSRLAQCRVPQDIHNEQMRFWQTAFQQYSESTQRMAALWTEAVQAGQPKAKDGGAQPAQDKRERDYITFPEAKSATPAQKEGPRVVGDQRKVA